MFPWNKPIFKDWSIIGMNHYFLAPRMRCLFVAMAHPSGRYVKAEGADEDQVFEELTRQIEHQNQGK